MTTINKVCTKCAQEKPLDAFDREKRGLHGRRADCKQCRNEYRKNLYHTSDKYRNAQKAYQAQHYQENTERIKDRVKRYAEQNKDKVLENKRRYWHEDVDKEAYNEKRMEQYYERTENEPGYREKTRVWGRVGAKRTKAKRKGAPGSYTSQEWEELCDRYGRICLCCKRKVKLTVDHIKPISKGGSNDISNLQPLCSRCNRKKHTKTIDYRPDK
jgi:5-methylcytosine-specific restriction endonuclease McrA